MKKRTLEEPYRPIFARLGGACLDNFDKKGERIEPPEILNQIVDTVLAYRPKGKSEPKRRKRK